MTSVVQLEIRLWREGSRFLVGSSDPDLVCEGSTKEEAKENFRSALSLLNAEPTTSIKVIGPTGTGP